MNTTHECANAGTDLIIYPEAAITGLISNDDPIHDLPMGQPIPGNVTGTLTKIVREQKIYLATGSLEREGNKLYDSAILLIPDGQTALKYRRMNPQRMEDKQPQIFIVKGRNLRK